MRSSRPSTASSGEPRIGGSSLSHPGSARRFSQPLSGFLASPSSTALFRAAAVPERSLQSFPLAEIVYPSRGHWLPCGHPPACRDAPRRRLVAAGFPDARALRRGGLVPPTTMGPLSTRGAPLASRSPWTTLYDALTASFTRFEAFLPLSSPFARTRVAPGPRPLLSWAFAPPETSPQPSEPPTRPSSRARTPLAPAGARARRQGTAPPDVGWTDLAPANRERSLRRQSPDPFESGPRRLSATTPPPLALVGRASPPSLTFGVSE